MAGLGVEFRRLTKADSYWGVLKTFGISVSLAAGPWIITMIIVGTLALMAGRWAPASEIGIFTSGVMYAFAASLLLMGPVFMVFSRYLADQFHIGNTDQRMAFGAVQAGAVLAGLSAALPLGFFLFPAELPQAALLRASWIGLLTFLCGVWPAMSYMDFLRRYSYPLLVFLFGAVVAAVLCFLFRGHGAGGLLSAYALGMGVVFVGLATGVVRTVHPACPLHPRQLSARAGLRRYAALACIGFLYNLGVWADKFVVWLMKGRFVDGTAMRALDVYDVPTFMAYIAMIPGIAFFLLSVEGRFQDDYRAYLDAVENDPLRGMEEKRATLLQNLRHRLAHLAELQTLVAAAAFFIGPFFLRRWGLGEESVRIYRVLLVAASLQVYFLGHLILLLYFEFRRVGVVLTALFVASNVVFTWFNLRADVVWGVGYLLSMVITNLFAIGALREGLGRLHRHIFFLYAAQTSPSVPRPRRRGEDLPSRLKRVAVG